MDIRSLAAHHLIARGPKRLRESRTFSAADALRTPSGLTYIICTNPRSGSWLLSEGLAATSVAGNPREWFNPLEEQQHRARWRMEHSSDLTFPKYMRLTQRLSVTSNGVSGIKLHYHQFAALPRKMSAIEGLGGLTSAETLKVLFPRAKYIWLTRRDKARQAISYVLATRSDLWWRIGDSAGTNRDVSEFDAHTVARFEQALRKNETNWQSFFDTNHLQPFVVCYEDLVQDYQGTIIGVLAWLGIPDAARTAVAPPRLKRQSNAVNEDWLRRYMGFKNETVGAPLAHEDPPSDDVQSGGEEKQYERVGEHWNQWIGQSKALGVPDETIVDTLVSNGFTRAAAAVEIQNAASDPFLIGAAATVRHSQRGASVLGALGQLASLDSRLQRIERLTNVSTDEFRDRYYAANRPVILTGLMTDWRAMGLWTPEYLKNIAGDHVVEVMTGRNRDTHYERSARAHRTPLRFAEYIDMVYSGTVTNDYYLVANNSFFTLPAMQPLLADIGALPAYLKQTPGGRQCFLWFGPAGTITPLHRDTSNILLAQVVGRKRYRLIPSCQWDCVYNRQGVFSDVDCERPDPVQFPKFRHATVIDFVVEAGEVLFVPVGWWHHVRALDVSITVSFTAFVFPNYFTWGA